MTASLRLDGQTWLLVLTGAGVSAESGLPTFRGAGGLWEGRNVQEVASPEAFEKDPAMVWRFYSARREAALKVVPNAGHHALAAAEKQLGERLLLATQNVDGLHREAGSERLVELHGRLFYSRCSACAAPPVPDLKGYRPEALPVCVDCGELMRPDIVWFGEALEPAGFERISRFIHAARGGRLIFLAAGTSGTVFPAAALVELAAEAGAQTWLVDAAPAREHGEKFDQVVTGNSGDALPVLLGGPGLAVFKPTKQAE